MIGALGRKSRPLCDIRGRGLACSHRFSPGRDVRKKNAETKMNA